MLIVAVLLFCGILFLLFTPLVFEIDSTRSLCTARISGIASATLMHRDASIWLSIAVLGWRKGFDLLAPHVPSGRHRNRKPIPKKQGSSRRFKPTIRHMLRLLRHLLGTVTLHSLYVDLDTGDWLVNAELIAPVFFLTTPTRVLKINFRGDVVFKLTASDNIARILRVMILDGIPTLYSSIKRS